MKNKSITRKLRKLNGLSLSDLIRHLNLTTEEAIKLLRGLPKR